MILLGLTKSELRRFLRWVRNPINFLRTVTHCCSLYFSRRKSKNPIALNRRRDSVPGVFTSFRFSSAVRPSHTSRYETMDEKITLAGTEYFLRDGIDWNGFFEDKEDYNALHRFGWLNSDPAFFCSSQYGLELIENWIETFHHNESDVAYGSYNISERLINWVLFFTRWSAQSILTRDLELRLHRSIEKQLYFLANHLEQAGESYTNNHLLNNGRALYLVGWFISDTSMIELGRECIRFGHRRLITAKGWLNEHSSHYHLLICKHFLEIYLVAVEFDQDFKQELDLVLKRLFRVASLLIGPNVDSPIPLIGDISPDAPPRCLARLCHYLTRGEGDARAADSAHVRWFDVWDIREIDLSACRTARRSQNVFFDEEGGFFAYENDEFRFYFHNPLSGSRPNFSHYHPDDGGFTLIHEDFSVIQDVGRPSYIQSHVLSQYGKSSYSHNTVFFDCTPISPPEFNWFPPGYGRPRAAVEGSFSEETVVLQLFHDGFRRIQKGLRFHRRFELNPTTFRLKDSWRVPVSGRIKTRFHLGTEIREIRREKDSLVFVFRKSKNEISLKYSVDGLVEITAYKGVLGSQAETCAGWSFPRYGAAFPSYTVDFEQERAGSFVNEFEIRAGKNE